MGCSGCGKKKKNFRDQVNAAKQSVEKTPRQKRIEARQERIKRRKERIEARQQRAKDNEIF